MTSHKYFLGGIRDGNNSFSARFPVRLVNAQQTDVFWIWSADAKGLPLTSFLKKEQAEIIRNFCLFQI